MLHFERTAETRSLASGVRLRTANFICSSEFRRNCKSKVEVEKEALKWLRKRD